MKKTIFTLVVATFIAGTVMISCKPSTKEGKESQDKVEVAKENVQDAKDSLAVAKKAATDEEWKAFKAQTDSVIKDNDARIAELKLKMKKTGKSIDAKYQKNIEILEQKNKDLKVKMDDYKNDVDSDWQSFKREFKHDTDEIGQALKDLTVDNKK
jgi:predicted RNase H-like nuclease (RuvC/YqgF family)